MARRALETFAYTPEGQRHPDTVIAGELYPDDHDAVGRWPHQFEDPDVELDRRRRLSAPVSAQPVEATTAAPGEKRSTRIPRGKSKGTKADDG
jgi:hypothetical protein